MDSLFAGSSSLQYMPDNSKWDMKNTTNINLMFGGCLSLISIPDISNWNTKLITNMSGLFYNSSKLKSLDISKWDVNNANNITLMISKCHSLESLPEISKWNACNVNNI